MNTDKANRQDCPLSAARLSRIRAQGYGPDFTDEQIAVHALGNRLAYQLCTLLFGTGLVLTSIPILAVAAVIAALAVVLPYHPFDYLYNHAIRHWLDRPELPPRTNQAKFACGIAAVWLGAVIFLFYASLFLWGYVLGGVLLAVALLVSTIDLCIPSMIYNAVFGEQETSSRT